MNVFINPVSIAAVYIGLPIVPSVWFYSVTKSYSGTKNVRLTDFTVLTPPRSRVSPPVVFSMEQGADSKGLGVFIRVPHCNEQDTA